MSPADSLFAGDFRLSAIRAIRQDVKSHPDMYSPVLVDAAEYILDNAEFARVVCTENE